MSIKHMSKGRKLIFLVLMIFTFTFIVVGCSGGNDQPASDKAADNGDTNEGSTSGNDSGSVERISIATGGTGGTYYPYGGTMADIINKNVQGIEAAAEVTGASVENARLLESGASQLALMMNDVVFKAINGEEPFKEKLGLRTLIEMYPNVQHVVTLKDSGIQTIEGLKGKKVSVGAPGSGTETMANGVLGAVGITYDDFEVFRLSFAENTQGLRDGVIDVGIWSVGAPTSSVMDLATTHDIEIINFSDSEVESVVSELPYYNKMELPAGSYEGQDEAVTTIAVWNTVGVHKDMPEETAYGIAKAIFENVDKLIQVYPGAKLTTPENLVNNAVAPLHPGVVRYLEEIDVEVPDRLIPSEMK